MADKWHLLRCCPLCIWHASRTFPLLIQIRADKWYARSIWHLYQLREHTCFEFFTCALCKRDISLSVFIKGCSSTKRTKNLLETPSRRRIEIMWHDHSHVVNLCRLSKNEYECFNTLFHFNSFLVLLYPLELLCCAAHHSRCSVHKTQCTF